MHFDALGITKKRTKLGTLEIMVVAVASLLLFSTGSALPQDAFAYTANDPAVPYHCFIDQNGDGAITAADEVEDEEGNMALVPCEVSPGDNAWMMTAAALVLVMTPAGLAMFYGGLARQKNAVNTIHMVFITTGVIAVQWVLWGYSLAFGPDATGQGFIGDFSWVGLQNVLHDVPSNAYYGINSDGGRNAIPHQTYMVFQMMFAIITPALIVASLAERMKFSAFIIFIVIWATFVYDFAAHWTWQITATDNYGRTPGYCGFGWGGCLGALDFAGGTVIHITSGWSGLVIALMLGRRLGYGKMPMEPHNVSLVVLGAALLWFGWFGFNAGSAAAAATNATSAFVATQIATGMAAVTWALVSWGHTGRPSTVGAASGAVAGLVAITPASGFVSPMSAIVIGIAAGIGCYYAVTFKNRRKWDDALDTWAIHGIGGLIGALLTGTFAEQRFTPWGDNGLAFGNPAQLYENAVGAFAALAWAMGITAIIIKVMDVVWPGGIRVTPKEEEIGLDLAQHGERAYVTG
ncbi:ammonium transporter NrgA [Candidatus Nitrososphaera gargensis Ga9.2]|uniref:Ammonium transporter n=1 Tax=Nitrososphaera gargensis (strain Ga9.2) TaxID=1237085 RepID=K0IP03_NITGG|nr:ammonium transporter [Candidatus Nitrososphaera gargensis]AFU60274.1 ammonium transporter NrgA [Candidatus Nitrososphaera gargensis Ga9.2]